MEYIEIFIALFSFISLLFLFYYLNKSSVPINWPVFGMLPALVQNYYRINELCKEVLEKSPLTFQFMGPWFTNMHFLLTVDPSNVHHVMIQNVSNYHRGSQLCEIMELFGEGPLNSDGDIALYHRKIGQSFMSHPGSHSFFITIIREKMEHGLIPVLDHVSKLGLEVDLQDLFSRLTFDNICTMIMGYNPRSLSTEFSSVPPITKALDDAEEAIANRFAMPTCIWKFQRWLGIGLEKKYKEAWKTCDTFVYKVISERREEMKNKEVLVFERKEENEAFVDLLTFYMGGNRKDDKFLRDAIITYILAGRDAMTAALTWFFYVLSMNPKIVSKIREELDAVILQKEKFDVTNNFKQISDKLVYLHGALCEVLRLYAPGPFQAKVPIQSDVLPSGHKVDPSMRIVFSSYAMGRMKSIWGDDCDEFKPERWISEKGGIRHEPSYKFFSFNAGPRTCLGKEMAFTQMKIVVATILKNYNIQAIQGHPLQTTISLINHMKNGFKVKVSTYK